MPLALTVFLALLLGNVLPVAATELPDITELRHQIQIASRLESETDPQISCVIDDKKITNCYAYLEEVFQAKGDLARLTPRIFNWQLRASNVILVLVVLLTVCGIVFALFQLILPQGIRKGDLTESPAMNTIELGSGSIKISSPIIGLLVLAFAYFFLILFLREVYRIDVVSLNSKTYPEVTKVEPTASARPSR